MKAIILAAGESSRFKPLSDHRHKGLTEVCGKPIIEHTVRKLQNIGIEDVVIVEGPEKKFRRNTDLDCEFVVQQSPDGMGDAIEQAEDYISGKFLVLNPYHVLSIEIIERLIAKSEAESTKTGFVSRKTDSPEDYGVLDIENGMATGVTEKPSPEQAPSNQRIVGIYLLNEQIFEQLNQTEKWEYQFEDALDKEVADTPGTVLKISEPTASLKYPWDMLDFTSRYIDRNMENQIHEDAEIADSAKVEGKVKIEKGVNVYENAVIRGPAYIGENAVIGNNSLIRDGSLIESGCTVGTNTEIKNTVIQPKSSIHSGFLGDSVIGRNTKIGAEVVTANRLFRNNQNKRPDIESELLAKDRRKNTNKSFLGAMIGDNVDVGVNVSLMPGVQISSGEKVHPGTVVKNNIKTISEDADEEQAN